MANAKEEKDNWEPDKHRRLSMNVETVQHFGCNVPDINYGGLGSFVKLLFHDEESMLYSLHWLDIVGSKPAPSYATSLKLARCVVRGHPVQGNPCIVVNYAPHLAEQRGRSLKG